MSIQQRITLLAANKTEKPGIKCPNCKELPYWTKGWGDNGAGDIGRYRECRLCGHKMPIKGRMSKKKQELENLIQELVRKK